MAIIFSKKVNKFLHDTYAKFSGDSDNIPSNGTLLNVQTVKFKLTNDQIKAFPNTPVILIPSAGENKIVSIDSVKLFSNIVTPYKNSLGADFAQYDYLSIDTTYPYSPIVCVNADNASCTGLTGILTSSRYIVLPVNDGWAFSTDWGSVVAKNPSAAPEVIINQGIQVSISLDSNLTDNLTGGDPANYIIIVLGYSIVDLS